MPRRCCAAATPAFLALAHGAVDVPLKTRLGLEAVRGAHHAAPQALHSDCRPAPPLAKFGRSRAKLGGVLATCCIRPMFFRGNPISQLMPPKHNIARARPGRSPAHLGPSRTESFRTELGGRPRPRFRTRKSPEPKTTTPRPVLLQAGFWRRNAAEMPRNAAPIAIARGAPERRCRARPAPTRRGAKTAKRLPGRSRSKRERVASLRGPHPSAAEREKACFSWLRST